ncbi:uncharacterized protein LOC130895517 [Diorhabda carinulata]|uniref:uncharacterized protein LOC130895517 n=1 Tax=Diorhabda carinulata TaxID=1163345 RepID=UPI00259FF4B5|nr:uncharacterized protein LOC130895517 [Diorhabda carinulata]
MHSINKNSYLHNYLEDINPRLINRCVEKAMGYKIIDEHDLEPPFNRLISEQPNIPVKNLDLIHRPIGFGRYAMPKLRRELHNKDPTVVIAAIESISELVVDSSRAYEALELRIVERMTHLLVDENPAIRERCARALTILAILADAKKKIVANKILLNNISVCSEDPYEEVRLHVAELLERLSEFWLTADSLVEFGFIQIILHILQSSEEKYIMLIHLRTLRCMLYGIQGKMIALEYSGYHILMSFLNDENSEVLAAALECTALLTSTCIGEKLARESNLLNTLDKLLQDESVEVYTQAAHCIMFCTVKGTGKIMASKYPRMVHRLIELCQNKENLSTQIFGLSALKNICEHPAVRKRVNAEYRREIGMIQIGADPCIQAYKDSLLTVISWSPDSAT